MEDWMDLSAPSVFSPQVCPPFHGCELPEGFSCSSLDPQSCHTTPDVVLGGHRTIIRKSKEPLISETEKFQRQ